MIIIIVTIIIIVIIIIIIGLLQKLIFPFDYIVFQNN